MPAESVADLDTLKARIRSTWIAGDYDRIAQVTAPAAVEFVARRAFKPGIRVLDVACGTGNLAIPAGKVGAIVTGVDIAPNLLDQARARAAQEKLGNVAFDEGDAESLPCKDASFDAIVSMFGAMFAPRPDLVARELARVCRHGGQIALANWTPSGFVGQLFKTTARHLPPPSSGVPSPLLWGDEETVGERLRGFVSDLRTQRMILRLSFPFSVPETVEFYRLHYGPTLKAFASLAEAARSAFRRDLEQLYTEANDATDGTTSIAAEYLEIVAIKQ